MFLILALLNCKKDEVKRKIYYFWSFLEKKLRNKKMDLVKTLRTWHFKIF